MDSINRARLTAFICLFLHPALVLAGAIHVPDDYPTIQGAIDAAEDGDEIVVAPGVYAEAIDLVGKAIHVMSSDGPEVTTIDATGLDTSTVTCASGEDLDTLIEGFTITGGTGTLHDLDRQQRLHGGGLFIDRSGPTISGCTFIGNTAEFGGGMSVTLGDATLLDCRFISNHADCAGGGVYNLNSGQSFSDCYFQFNTTSEGECGWTHGGGGAYLDGQRPSLLRCVFRANRSPTRGGAIRCSGSLLTITGSAFSGNEAPEGGAVSATAVLVFSDCLFNGNFAEAGGAVYARNDSAMRLSGCTLSGNEGERGGAIWSVDEINTEIGSSIICGNLASEGAGIYADEGIDVHGSLVIGNAATERGGGVYLDRARGASANCTYVGNGAPAGGAIHARNSEFAVENGILWGNQGGQVDVDDDFAVRFTNVEGGFEGMGNIERDPRFPGSVGGTWTHDGFFDIESYRMTFFDDNASWTPDELVGAFVEPVVSEEFASLQFLILQNTATTITVWADWRTIDDQYAWVESGAEYRVHDYRLSPESPCIDAANNDAVPRDGFDLDGDDDLEEPIPFDVAGLARFADDPDTEDTGIGCTVVDMGAYEFQADGPGREAEPPTDLQASDGEFADKIVISWQGPRCTDDYRVYRHIENDRDAATPITDWQSETSFEDTRVARGQTYWYWVRARNDHSESGFSDGDSGFRLDLPAPPTELEASDGAFANSVDVDWQPSPTAIDYRVFRHTENDREAASPIGEWIMATHLADRTAEPERVYFYWVIARNQNGKSGFSNGDSGYRQGVPPPPTELRATDGAFADRVDLEWQAARTAGSYRVYRHFEDDPQSAEAIGDWTSQTFFSDRTAEPGQVYHYWVTARNLNGESDFSEGETGFRFDVPSPPNDLQATDGVFSSVVYIDWSATPFAEDYRVLRHVENEPDASTPISDWRAETYFGDRTAIPGQVYFYWVVPRNLNGEGDRSQGDCGFRRDPDRCLRSRHSCCDGDVSADGQVDAVDLGIVQANFGNSNHQALCDYDMDCDGEINPIDSGIVQSLFGSCDAPRDVCP